MDVVQSSNHEENQRFCKPEVLSCSFRRSTGEQRSPYWEDGSQTRKRVMKTASLWDNSGVTTGMEGKKEGRIRNGSVNRYNGKQHCMPERMMSGPLDCELVIPDGLTVIESIAGGIENRSLTSSSDEIRFAWLELKNLAFCRSLKRQRAGDMNMGRACRVWDEIGNDGNWPRARRSWNSIFCKGSDAYCEQKIRECDRVWASRLGVSMSK